MTRVRALPAIAAAILGCSSPSPSIPDAAVADAGVCPVASGDAAVWPLAGRCPLDQRLGGFKILPASVSGSVRDAVMPLEDLQDVGGDGDCRLLRRPNPHCTPPCNNGFTCGLDGACLAQPLEQDIGVVHIEGLVVCLDLSPHTPGALYYATDVPDPLFVEGALVRLSTGAGSFGPLELHGIGTTPLIPGALTWTLHTATPLDVAWDVPPPGLRSRVDIRINIDQHGASPVTLVCDVADTGSFTIPAALIDELYSFGLSGYPSGSLIRRTADAQAVAGGCVDLIVGDERAISVVAP